MTDLFQVLLIEPYGTGRCIKWYFSYFGLRACPLIA
jgi:hypothetical protein